MRSARSTKSRVRPPASCPWCRASPSCCSIWAWPPRWSVAPALRASQRAGQRVAKVGGTKSIEVWRIKRLAPTHLIVNIDENPRATVEELSRFVPHVIVTHPLGPADNPRLYRLLGRIFLREEAGADLCRRFERDIRTPSSRGFPVAAAKGPLSHLESALDDGVAGHVYVAHAGRRGLGYVRRQERSALPVGRPETCAAERARVVCFPPSRTPSASATASRSRQLPAGSHTRVALIDGAMTSWYGSRAIQGLHYLRDFRAGSGNRPANSHGCSMGPPPAAPLHCCPSSATAGG